MIQKHSLWEIGNGDKAFFWEDSSQQRFQSDQDQYQQIMTEMKNRGRTRVCHYWKPNIVGDSWREWLDQEDWAPHINR